MSELLIEGLNVALQPIARHHRSIAEHLGIDIVFTAGYRAPAEQTALYAKGRDEAGHVVDPSAVVTWAIPEKSAHCRHAAYDIVPIVHEHAAWDRLDLFAQLGRIGRDLGLVWGGDWLKIRDMPHFELLGWRTLPFQQDLPAVA